VSENIVKLKSRESLYDKLPVLSFRFKKSERFLGLTTIGNNCKENMLYFVSAVCQNRKSEEAFRRRLRTVCDSLGDRDIFIKN